MNYFTNIVNEVLTWCHPELTVVETYDVLFVTGDIPAIVYLYKVTTKTSTLLTIPNILTQSDDIAHTDNKLWLYRVATPKTIFEWNITLAPFTAVYNREITNIKSSAGMGAANSSKLISFEYVDALNHKIYDTDITNLAAVNTFKYNGIAGRNITGDFILTTTNKLIALNNIIIPPYTTYITQYDYLTGAVEFDIDISSIFPGSPNPTPYGLFEYDSEIYIAGPTGVYPSPNGVIYKIEKVAPYSMTLYDSTSYRIYGASQVPEQLTVHFT